MTATAVAAAPYALHAVDRTHDTWPEAGWALLDELRAARGRYALVAAPLATADALVARLAADLDLEVARLGAALAEHPTPPATPDIESAIGDAVVLADLDVLFWPALAVPIHSFLATRARRVPTIAVWPGEVIGGRARYSAPGRPDHHDARLADVVVLRPRATSFPDEVPFEIERTAP